LAPPLLFVGHGVAIGILQGTTHLIRHTRETHEVPSGVQERATRAGGVNRYGEPRLSRGVGRLSACVDWETLDRSRCARKRHSRKVEPRHVPKYLPEERGTSSAGRRQNPMARRSGGLRKQLKSRMACAWRRWTVPLAWRLRRLLHARKRWGQGHSTHAAACDWIVGVIEWSRRQWRTEMRGAIAARKTRHLDRGMDDILDDAVPAYHDQPFVTA
jgi:hypothetical protein